MFSDEELLDPNFDLEPKIRQEFLKRLDKEIQRSVEKLGVIYLSNLTLCGKE